MAIYIVIVALIATVVTSVLSTKEKYTTKWDNINLDDILHSDRLLDNYFKCLMVKGPCTPDAKDLRDALPDALATDCEKCSEKQKEGSEKVVNFLMDNKPDKWKELSEKYDPSGQYEKHRKEKVTMHDTPVISTESKKNNKH